MRCIIPAAGFGTRMGMKPDQSKEMLPDPNNKHKPIIAWALELCKVFNMEPIVLTREDKKDLRQYLFNKGVEFIDVKPEGEWYDTVLESKQYWKDNNLLLLPDTRFDRLTCIKEIQIGLELGNKAVIALHGVIDPSKWGIIKDYMLFEKPKHLKGKQWAWGLMGFTKFEGECIFTAMNYNTPFYLENTGFTYLNKFEDITRGSK